MTESTTTLYRFHDASGGLLYVGITGRSVRRWCEHAATKPWWNDVAKVTVEHFTDRPAAINAEARAIKQERPAHNVVHSTTRTAAGKSKPTRISWTCDKCDRDIADGDGWVTVPHDSAAWGIYHRGCDPDPVGGYWIAVERLRTPERLVEFDRHLQEKRWIHDTDWHAIFGIAYQQLGSTTPQ